MTPSVARRVADPASCSDREPPVPPPRGTRAVSPSTKEMFSTAIPVISDTIIA